MLAFLLQGGGISVGSGGGVANLDGCQVYENVLSYEGYVRSHYEPSQNLHPSPAGTLRVLMVGRVAGDS